MTDTDRKKLSNFCNVPDENDLLKCLEKLGSQSKITPRFLALLVYVSFDRLRFGLQNPSVVWVQRP